jgi:hypothetical protein
VVGMAFGLVGQQLLDGALAGVIGFPVVCSVAVGAGLVDLGLVLAVASIVLALPGYVAAGVSPAVALED